MAKDFFNENNVDYTDYDVSTDSSKAQEMVDLSGQMGVPVIVFGDGEKKETIIGFDEEKIRNELGL